MKAARNRLSSFGSLVFAAEVTVIGTTGVIALLLMQARRDKYGRSSSITSLIMRDGFARNRLRISCQESDSPALKEEPDYLAN
jgi:hypothetical protein